MLYRFHILVAILLELCLSTEKEYSLLSAVWCVGFCFVFVVVFNCFYRLLPGCMSRKSEYRKVSPRAVLLSACRELSFALYRL